MRDTDRKIKFTSLVRYVDVKRNILSETSANTLIPEAGSSQNVTITILKML